MNTILLFKYSNRLSVITIYYLEVYSIELYLTHQYQIFMLPMVNIFMENISTIGNTTAILGECHILTRILRQYNPFLYIILKVIINLDNMASCVTAFPLPCPMRFWRGFSRYTVSCRESDTAKYFYPFKIH